MEKTETALAGSRPSCAGSPRARSPGAPSSTPMACCSHALRGIFINFVDHWCPRFFARPSSESERPGNLDFLPSYTRGYGSILDHCNGLLLYEGRFKREFYVVNPATRWWECLPRHTGFPDYYIGYLVFDPAVSPHYEVFLIPYFPETPIPVGVPRYDPPSPVNLHGLFSLPDDAPDDVEDTEEEEDLTEGEPVESPSSPRSTRDGWSSSPEPSNKHDKDPDHLMESPLSPRSAKDGWCSSPEPSKPDKVPDHLMESPLSPTSTKDGWCSSPEPSKPDKDPDHLMESPLLSPRSTKDGWCSSPEPSKPDKDIKDPDRLMEWPPSPYTFYVFSSCTGRWGKRSFVREGEAVGTAKDVKFDTWGERSGPRKRYGVYWRQALYVHCRGAFVMRLSLTNCTYQAIKTPTNTGLLLERQIYLGRSEKGVYFTTIDNYSQLRIWILDESHGQMEWVLKHHDLDLYPYVSRAVVHSEYHEVTDGPWILLENDHDNDNDTTDNDKVLRNGDYDWDSDEDNILDEDGDEEQLTDSKRIYFLGFHPYKEIIFLMTSSIGIAYHLNTSKVQYLGRLIPNNYYSLYRHAAVYESFLYTPFMSGDPSNTNNENHPDNQQYI